MPYRNQEDIGCRAGARQVLRGVLGVCLVAAFGILGAAGVRSAESWQILLTHQLKEQQRCILSEVLFANEIRVGERVGLVGRIRCSDAREYDFEQQQTNQPFVIRLCQPAVC